MAAPAYDLSSRGFAADPYPVYSRLLEHAPVFHSQESGLWYVCRHADVMRLLRDPRISADYSARLTARLDEESRTGTKRLLDLFSRMTLYRDPPAQAILHRAIRRAVGADLVSALDPCLASIARRLLDDVEAAGTFEVMRDLAFPLPAIVIAELLGAPEGDLALFRRWAHDIASFLGVPTDAAAARHTQRSLDEAADYFRALLPRYASDTSPRREPWRGLFLRELTAARLRHPELTEDDVIACCVMLVFAGHETTTGLIGNALWCLLRHPEQLDALREAPTLVAAAID
jgi:cytochrome P450